VLSGPVRATAALVVAAALLATVGPPAAAGPQRSRLIITVDSGPGLSQTWTLRCDPVGGSHPRRGKACAFLEGLARPFAPLPPDLACTMVYGGPERARVTGHWHGRLVDVSFARTNGCEIARWQQYQVLLTPPGGVSLTPLRAS
jgi:hypothetical protein